MAEYAKKYQMAMVVPVYEREQAGVYYNTAAVFDADGTYLGKYRKNHIPHTSGFWEKYFFKPGNLGYPVFQTRYAKVGVYICYDRHFPEGARLLGLNGAEIVFNPSATVAGLSQYLWKLEQPAHAVANGYFMACIEPRRHRGAVEHRQVLRHALLRRSARQLPRDGVARTRTSSSSAEMDLDMIEEVRRIWQFYRDRRPETYRRWPSWRTAARRERRLDPDQNGTVVTATDLYRGDVLVEDEKIAAIGTSSRAMPGRPRRIDATGKYVIPGGIDVHTHLDMPFGGTTSADDFETGTIAAAHGGTTSIVDFAIQYKGQTLRAGARTPG